MADTITAKEVEHSQIKELLALHDPRWQQTPQRAAEARDFLNGDMPTPLPAAFEEAMRGNQAAGSFRVDLPQRTTVAMRILQMLARDMPRVMRTAVGRSIEAESISTKIEQGLNAVAARKYPWRDSVDKLLIDSCALLTVIPDASDWIKFPSYFEGDEDTESGRKLARSQWRRDAEGKPTKSTRYHRKKSAAEYDKRLAAWKSNNLPLRFQLYGPESFVPIFNQDYEIDAVITQRQFTVTELFKRSFIWAEDDGMMSPDGGSSQWMANTSAGKTRTLYELWAVDWREDGAHPFVAYSIDGYAAYKQSADGQMKPAVVDFREEWGMERLPVVFRHGLHWAHADPDKRGIPFTLPYMQSWRNVNAMATGVVVHSWWRGFPTLIEEPGPINMAIPEASLEGDSPDKVDIKPLSIVRVNGPVKELGTQGVSGDVYKLIQLMLGSNDDESPDAKSGSGASGFAMSVDRQFSQESLDDVAKASKELFEAGMSFAFEILTAIADRHGTVPIPFNFPVPIAQGRPQSTSRAILDFSAEWAGGVYDVEAEMPPRPNLALGQQWAQWTKDGLVLRREFREKIIGDPSPEEFEAELLSQKARDLPEGIAGVLALAAQIQGNEEEYAKWSARASGKAMQASNGQTIPTSMAQGVPPPMGMVGQGETLPGMGVSNPAQSVLASVVGGAMQTGPQANLERQGITNPLAGTGGP